MLDLMESYPEAAKVVKAFYLEKFLSSMKDDSVPEDFKEYARQLGIDNDKIAKMMEKSPRGMFDVFDAFDLYISIIVSTAGKSTNFSYKILPRDQEMDEIEWFSSRLDAEKMAISDAFITLNQKLCGQTQ